MPTTIFAFTTTMRAIISGMPLVQKSVPLPSVGNAGFGENFGTGVSGNLHISIKSV